MNEIGIVDSRRRCSAQFTAARVGSQSSRVAVNRVLHLVLRINELFNYVSEEHGH